MGVVDAQHWNFMLGGIFQGKLTQKGRCCNMHYIGLKLLHFFSYPAARKPGNSHFIGLVDRNGYGWYPHTLKSFDAFRADTTDEQEFELILRYPFDQLEHGTRGTIEVLNQDFCKKGNFDFW